MAMSPTAHALLMHLEEHRPTMVKEMEAAGTLDQYLEEKAEQILDLEESLWKQGKAPDQIRELTRDLRYPPGEDDAPETTD